MRKVYVIRLAPYCTLPALLLDPGLPESTARVEQVANQTFPRMLFLVNPFSSLN